MTPEKKKTFGIYFSSVLLCGIFYWPTPYNSGAEKMSSYILSWIIIIASISAYGIAFLGMSWKKIWLSGSLTLVGVFIIKAIIDSFKDPTSHNLLPFELIIAFLAGMMISGLGVAIGVAIKGTYTSKNNIVSQESSSPQRSFNSFLNRIRRAARITGSLLVAFTVVSCIMVFIDRLKDNPGVSHHPFSTIILIEFIIWGIAIAGLILALWKEGMGGWISLIAFFTMAIVNCFNPEAPGLGKTLIFFAILMIPALLYIFYWWKSKNPEIMGQVPFRIKPDQK